LIGSPKSPNSSNQGGNHLKESDDRPPHLCPVCLRKLQWSVGFDVVDRYRRLERFSRKAGFEDEVAWIGRRLRWIEGGPGR
jgi:archaemetzincin